MTAFPVRSFNGSCKPNNKVNDDPIYQVHRRLKVVVVGAGASGLLLAYKLQRHFDNIDITIFEKNAAVSGTWVENRYPGCGCDTPAHCYTWSFEPKTDWSANYASSSEIRQYFTDFCTRHALQKYIKLEHRVLSAEWLQEDAQWRVTVEDLVTKAQLQTVAHIFINAAGILNNWKWPDIPGLHLFKGKMLHSAAWDDAVDLQGKTVGLIGNGSSGIQILPAIQSKVQKLFHFVRQPTWIAPPIGEEYREHTREDIMTFASDPKHHLEMRRDLETRMNVIFETFRQGSQMQNSSREHTQTSMLEKLGKHELSNRLIPDFPVGCRRPTPGTGYLESLLKDNVHTVVGQVERIIEDGVVAEDGTTYPVDVLVCATGFDTTYRPRFPILGRTGRSLSDAWKNEIQGYLGIAVPDYPNYFMLLGPNCPVGNGPVLIAIEHQVSYIIQMLSKFQKENIRSFDVKADATESFNLWKDGYMEHTIWKQDCRSWYKAGSKTGKVVALWPGSTLHYLETIKTPRYEEWEWEYQRGCNRWAFLGNGHSTAEKRPGGDVAWYIRSDDDSPIDPCLKTSQGLPEKGVLK
ncbi:hypothetical protein AJ79_09812 [Helicocarpus griseus UAMH5409]|uniref:FAD/NAD(P)-binding domain-containing protein n=1 Tax=Helicocarpus griseus UAMH5409 TaxID=1447875 RepID=A0A2B7WH15_9EURO|nr:hypothetical protein AJ79_09812 [Helicocarpus griseus UAMH5409]